MADSTVTVLLQALDNGTAGAADALLSRVYDELREMARHRLRVERPGHTLDPTALVNEACVRLLGAETSWENRAHFFGAAAMAMRRILIEHARKHGAAKRGGRHKRVTFHSMNVAAAEPDVDVMALDQALDALVAFDERLSELVHLRFFVGLTIEQAAELLGISTATADRRWAYARAWLYRQMDP